jgi:hypothetical protein
MPLFQEGTDQFLSHESLSFLIKQSITKGLLSLVMMFKMLMNKNNTKTPLLAVLAAGLMLGMITACQSPTGSSSPSETTAVQDTTQPVPLALGETQELSGVLKANETIHFILVPQSGQMMKVALEGTGVQMTILDQDSQPIEDRADITYWHGMATYSGQYFVRLVPVPGAESSEYKVKLSLETL